MLVGGYLLYCVQLTGGYTTEENDFFSPGNNQQVSTVPQGKDEAS